MSNEEDWEEAASLALDAVRARVSMGEIVAALESVFGRWTEDPVI